MKTSILAILLLFSGAISAQDAVIEAFEKSYASEARGNYAEAVKSLESVYSESSYPLNLRLGWLQYMKGDFIKSKSYYEKAIGLEKSGIEARLGLIYPLTALNNQDEVIDVYHDILQIDPANTYCHYQLAVIYFQRKEYSDAEEHLLPVLRLYPFDFDSNALLGSVYVKMGKINEAKTRYRLALQYNPYDEGIREALSGL